MCCEGSGCILNEGWMDRGAETRRVKAEVWTYKRCGRRQSRRTENRVQGFSRG